MAEEWDAAMAWPYRVLQGALWEVGMDGASGPRTQTSNTGMLRRGVEEGLGTLLVSA